VSRTFRKGEKGPGYEYWSKRPGNKNGGAPGKYTKKRTHRLERIENKKKSKEYIEE
jgi:hypothetical protein